MLKVTGSRSKVEPWSDHDVAQLDHGRYLCAESELLPAYGHRDLARTKWQPPPGRPSARPPVQDENNTRTVMNGCGIKTKTYV